MQVTKHFSLRELTKSATAERRGISNNPTPEHLENMKYVCEQILEPVRAHFKKPVTINSSYRSPDLNRAVGGSSRSQHCNGQAVDFEIQGVSNKELADWIADNLIFDQVILEFYNWKDGKNSGWVHASIRKDGQNRGQRLIASKSAAGGTVYTAVNDFDPSTAPKEHKQLIQTATEAVHASTVEPIVAEKKCSHCGQTLPNTATATATPAVTPAVPVAARRVTETNPMKALQQKAGITADGLWGPGTFKAAMNHFKLSGPRAAHFFAQCAHESGNFKTFSENLNYSSSGLNKIFPKYFARAGRNAAEYHRKPEMIANVVYASRMGNGDTASGDGWKYRGRGAIQLTGKNNYTAFSVWAKRPDVLTNPDIVATELAFESALWFFESNNLWSICDKGFDTATITQLTRRINGGTHGLDDRIAKTKKYSSWI